MNTERRRIPSCSRVRSYRKSSRVFCLLLVLYLVVGLLLNPGLLQTAHAHDNAQDAQSAVALASCYGVYHIVRPGQTLYSIAAAYGTTAYRIAACNGLSSYTVYVGQALVVPYRPYHGG